MSLHKMDNVLGCTSDGVLQGTETVVQHYWGGVPVMLFPDEMKIEIGWPSRADGPLQG